MKAFELRELAEALLFADAGGQALHLMPASYARRRRDTPGCFKGRGHIAHLFDRDRARLVGKARALGVRVIKVEREGTLKQHIDLCRKPLDRALEECRAHADAAAARGLAAADVKP